MTSKGLNLENIPSLHIPLRFFNTAPWLGATASVLLAINGELTTQWSPMLLAATHLFTLGFMAMIMLGALFQVLPVISGRQIPGKFKLATLVHTSLFTGTLLLAWAFISGQQTYFYLMITFLGTSFVSFLFALGSVLIHKIAGGHSITAIKLAVLSLLLTVLFGVLKVLGYLYPNSLPAFISSQSFSYLHMLWGVSGWLLLLVIAVSFQVIPMFHVTPNYHAVISKYLPFVLFTGLVITNFYVIKLVQNLGVFLVCASAFSYALYSLILLSKRRRKVPDMTVNCWRLALTSLISTSLILCFSNINEMSGGLLRIDQMKVNILIGIFMLIGFACSVIIGMQYKIVPFLIYMHLQRDCGSDFEKIQKLPTMHTILPVRRAKIQFKLQLLSLITLIISLFFPAASLLSALILFSNFTFLGYSIFSASKLYVEYKSILTHA